MAIILGVDFTLLAGRGLAPPPWRWTRQELLFEALHKGVLAAVTHLAYRELDGHRDLAGWTAANVTGSQHGNGHGKPNKK